MRIVFWCVGVVLACLSLSACVSQPEIAAPEPDRPVQAEAPTPKPAAYHKPENMTPRRTRAARDAGADWCRYAQAYLQHRSEDRPLSCRTDRISRCIKLNNYGCLWQRRAKWRGTPWPDGTDGAHDGAGGRNGHSVFEHPKWSVVAAITWFEHRQKAQGIRTALELAERYSPWCDTIGSRGVRNDWARSCKGGAQPPRGFRGPRCRKPANGVPAPGQCNSCNCPNKIAEFWLKDTEFAIDDDLPLFDGDGKPTKLLASILKRKITLETGYRPTLALIDESYQVYAPEY